MKFPACMRKKQATNQSFMDFLKSEGWLKNWGYCNDYEILPETSGIYCIAVIDFDYCKTSHLKPYVAYVGKSTNLLQRISSHEVLGELREKLSSFSFAFVYFMNSPKDKIDELEKLFIRKYDPPYNLIHRIKRPLEIAA